MNRIPLVKPIIPVNNTKLQYDAFIAAVGYERRARHIAESLGISANERFACAFPDRKQFHYKENLNWYYKSGFEVEEVTDAEFRTWCAIALERIRSSKLTNQTICIDISSFNRFRIAVMIDIIRNLNWAADIQVDFLYSLAEFSPPSKELVPNRHVGPVLPSFAGWTIEPDRPPIAIAGLGFEEDQALGAIEHIQAAEAWVFLPNSPITAYADAVKRANRTLLESIPCARQLNYPVHQPFDCFVLLESLTNRILRANSPILFPFGPKMFTVCSILVSCIHPTVAVWRVSAGHEEDPIDRKPSDYIFGLRAEFMRVNSGLDMVHDTYAVVTA